MKKFNLFMVAALTLVLGTNHLVQAQQIPHGVPPLTPTPTDILPGTTNLMVGATGEAFINGNSVFFAVPEQNEDLNGDGDTSDSFVYRHDNIGNSAKPLAKIDPHALGSLAGIAYPRMQANSEGDVVYVTHEFSNGKTDLNGNGTFENLLCANGDFVGSFFSCTNFLLDPNGRNVMFLVDEATQGSSGTDLNGDGDKEDEVVHVYDISTETVKNLGLAVGLGGFRPFHLIGSVAAFVVNEVAQGADLNGDGDIGTPLPPFGFLGKDENVVHTYNFETGDLKNLMRAITQSPFVFDGNVAFAVDEFYQGKTDLNADGDTNDDILHVWDKKSATIKNLGVVTSQIETAAGSLCAFRVSESSIPADLNGDGDTSDQIGHVYDADRGQVTVTGLACRSTMHTNGEVVFFLVEEEKQGKVLNLDGDFLDDVPHIWYKDRGGAIANTQLASSLGFRDLTASIDEGDHLLPILVPEASQGGVDLNGDGDFVDEVLHLFNMLTGQMTNLKTTAPSSLSVKVEREKVAYYLSEASQSQDLNGDTDMSDYVLHVHDDFSGVSVNFFLAGGISLSFKGTLVFFTVSELAQGGFDLNGDGSPFGGSIAFKLNANF